MKTPTHDPESDYTRSQGDGIDRLWLFIAWVLFFLAGCWAVLAAARIRTVQWFKWKRVCAWCKCRIGGSPLPLVGTSHTICPSCAKSQLSAFQRFSISAFSSGPGDSTAPTVSAWTAAGNSFPRH